jgi:hypothetical protein
MKTMQDVENHIKASIEDFLTRPGMFGGKVAVEMLVYSYIGMLVEVRHPDYSPKKKRELNWGPMQRLLTEKHGQSSYPVSSYSTTMAEFVEDLREIRDRSYALIEKGLDDFEESSDD